VPSSRRRPVPRLAPGPGPSRPARSGQPGHVTEPLTPTLAGSLPGRDEDPAARQERDDGLRTFRSILVRVRARISPCSDQILRLRWFEGLPLDEIAALLGLTPAQVRYRHHRVLRRLRALLDARVDRPESFL
jgi:RNA polymerase sigma factor (sigma-70 family)